MAEIKLLRVDFRLIHGQVITKWFSQSLANEILIVDDDLSNDPFMASIYEMSAPPGAKVVVKSVDDAVLAFNEDALGAGKLFVLFRNVEQIYRAWRKGFPVHEVQIGGLGSAPGRKVVFGPITMDDADAKMLKEMHDEGIYVYLHQVPEEGKMDFSKVLEKNDFHLD